MALRRFAAAKRETFDLVLTDVNMPVMDGWQLLRMLRADDELRHLPVIFLTTLLSERDRMRGYAQGVDDYIDKPFDLQDLIGRVERLLQRGRAERQVGGTERTLHGDLRYVSLGSLLSFLESDRHSGVLRLSRSGERAEIALRAGYVCGVTVRPALPGELTDLQRMFALLDWEEGEFDLQGGSVELDGELGLPMAYVLIEHARLKDIAAREAED